MKSIKLITPFNSMFDHLFSDLNNFPSGDFNKHFTKEIVPVNVIEEEKAYRIEVDAPGFEKTDFKIAVEDGLLTISSERVRENKTEQEKFVRKEFSRKSFKRSFTLDETIDATGIEASYINGVLTLNLPKAQEVSKPVQQISIR